MHSVYTTCQFHVASAVLVPAAAWLSPWDGAELLLSASAVPMPQRTWMCKQLLQEGHDTLEPGHLSLLTVFFGLLTLFLQCSAVNTVFAVLTAPPLDFCVAHG